MKKNIYTRLIVTGVLITLILIGIIFFVDSRIEPLRDRRIGVSATFYPVAFLAEQIGGNLVTVKTIVSPGIEPHDFDPSLRDIADIYHSKLFLLNGAGIDMWAERMQTNLHEKGVRSLMLSQYIPPMDIALEDESGIRDPHFWLDPVAYGKSAEAVLRMLVEIDPANARIYRSNFNRLQKNLQGIDIKFRALTTARCDLRTIVVPHDAFSYLAKRYGFEVYTLSGINPEQEVSAGALSDAVRFMRENGIHAVLTERFGNEDIAQTIASETDASILMLNPIEGLFPAEILAGENYLTLMEKNWISLRKALECR